MNKKIPLIVISVLIFILLLILFLPGKTISFEIKDRCGPIVNMISHTVGDQASCISQCKSQCESKKLSYNKVEFSDDNLGCNICNCECREKWI